MLPLPHIAVITCAVLEDEVLHLAQDATHIVHIEIMEQGLHNDPSRLRCELQATIERIEAMPEVQALLSSARRHGTPPDTSWKHRPTGRERHRCSIPRSPG